MRNLVHRRTDKLLQVLDEAAACARERDGVEEVHQLRVATRRLSQNLRTFRPFFARVEVRKVRKQLRALRDIAADLRSRDIALEQWRTAQLPTDAEFAKQLTETRQQASGRLREELTRWNSKKYPDRWRKRLGTRGEA